MKRIIHECDKCGKTVERADPPADWCIAAIRSSALPQSQSVIEKLWCYICWRDICEMHAKAGKL